MDRRGFIWRLLGALAAPAVCWRPPGMDLATDLEFSSADHAAGLALMDPAFWLAMEPPNREPLRFGQLYDPERWG